MDQAGIRLSPLLLAKNMRVIVVQLPLMSVEDDLAATNRIVADTEGRIVLVGSPLWVESRMSAFVAILLLKGLGQSLGKTNLRPDPG
jgi:hypothetical protein